MTTLCLALSCLALSCLELSCSTARRVWRGSASSAAFRRWSSVTNLGWHGTLVITPQGLGGHGTVFFTPLGVRCHAARHMRHVQAGTRTAYVQQCPARAKLPCAFGTYSTQAAGTRSKHVQYQSPGRYVLTQ